MRERHDDGLVCGLKLTHDGGVAVVEGNRLIASVEVEKLDNRHRYAELGDLGLIERVLSDLGIKPTDIDAFAVDGWGYGETDPVLTSSLNGESVALPVAPYREQRITDDSLSAFAFAGLPIGRATFQYTSYRHTTGHLLSSYCASPFAARGEDATVVVWDGGTVPRAYRVCADRPRVENLGPVLGLIGNVYPTFAMHFPPFRPEDAGPHQDLRFAQLTVPGKVMAYVALGVVRDDLVDVLDAIHDAELDVSMGFAETLAVSFLRRTARMEVSSADALASFQHWLGRKLVAGLRGLRDAHPNLPGNLCFSGGCALNIKWNGMIRSSGVFDDFWVPPFPNDSGSALGAACSAMVARTGQARLDWSVYDGPALIPAGDGDAHGYTRRDCSVEELAQLLHVTGEPVVVLHDRAELGPRALGNRSILAAAQDPTMKDTLNVLKGREYYRPVSPICLVERSVEVFDPGGHDPYMLFDHRVRPDWVSRVPAVVHLDGSARLQTVDADTSPFLTRLLTAYERLSGVPVLCNTSANFNGRGFFPDVGSALSWGRTRLVWADGSLYARNPENEPA